jgi:hypothetical protein
MKKLIKFSFIFVSLIYGISYYSIVGAQPSSLTHFGKISWEESTVPIRPGNPGKVPFWNGHAFRFIYAPAFDFKTIEQAVEYRYEIVSLDDSKNYSFENKVPYAPLSKVWKDMPVGQYNLKVVGISKQGDVLGLSGEKNFYRAAPFNGIYHEPVMQYAESAVLALDQLLAKDYVEYWLDHRQPDINYLNYQFPAKIMSALVIGAVTHARLKPGTADAERSQKLAKIVADYMLAIRFKEGTPWEYFVPTYYGPHFEEIKKEHLNPIYHFSIMGVDAGCAFLDLYDYSGEEKYLEAAKNIADTYLKRQLDTGSWYQFVIHETVEPSAETIVIPTSVINYFDRLKTQYGVKGLEKATAKALKWIFENPVKTFNWQGQFEDIKLLPPYRNLSREQACDLAIYLFRNKKDEKLAEELVRFAEDQFVIWEQPMKIARQQPRPGGNSENWITPSVQEQYVFWMPVGRAAGIMLQTYWEAYTATKKEIYLAKAKSIANSFTMVQKANDGDFPTFFTQYPMNQWLNSTVYPAKILMALDENLNQIKKGD